MARHCPNKNRNPFRAAAAQITPQQNLNPGPNLNPNLNHNPNPNPNPNLNPNLNHPYGTGGQGQSGNA